VAEADQWQRVGRIAAVAVVASIAAVAALPSSWERFRRRFPTTSAWPPDDATAELPPSR
jgi:hypothetical protein